LGTGKTRQQTLAELGIVTQVVPMARFEAGVDAVRNMFPSLWIDKSCDRLINALRNYRKELDEVRGFTRKSRSTTGLRMERIWSGTWPLPLRRNRIGAARSNTVSWQLSEEKSWKST
jgi:hypothetical protein